MLQTFLTAPELAFLRWAMLFGIVAAPALGVIGTLVVTRRISSLAGASAHAALGGIGIALFLERVCQWSFLHPLYGAVFGAVAAALVVGAVSLYGKEREDTVIGVVWALGMSLGLLLLDRTPGYVDWQGYLFGNILLLGGAEIKSMLILDAVILAAVALTYRQILAFSFDATFARLRGVKTGLIYFLILTLTALTIVLLINLVGVILVIALLTLPAAIAGRFTRHLYSMMGFAGILAAILVIVGLAVSYLCGLPSGPVIVVIAGVLYLLTLLSGATR